jgi:hypothetical protein
MRKACSVKAPEKWAAKTSSNGPQVLEITLMPDEVNKASSGHEMAPQMSTPAPSSTMRLTFAIGSASGMSTCLRVWAPSALPLTRTKHLAASSTGEIRSPSVGNRTCMPSLESTGHASLGEREID